MREHRLNSLPPIGLSRGLHPREGFPSRGIWSLGAMGSGPGQDQEFPCCRRCRCRCRPRPRKVVFRNGSKKHKSGKTRSWQNFHADRKIEIEIVHTNSSRRSYLEGFNPLRRRQCFCIFRKTMFFIKIKGFPPKNDFFIGKVTFFKKCDSIYIYIIYILILYIYIIYMELGRQFFLRQLQFKTAFGPRRVCFRWIRLD